MRRKDERSIKVKVVEAGALKAVSPHLTIINLPSVSCSLETWLPLLSSCQAAITFLVADGAEQHCPLATTKLYCLVTEAPVREQLVQYRCTEVVWSGVEYAILLRSRILYVL